MSENQVFEAACSWLQYDPGKRMDRACNILQNIRLALLESSYLENVVLKSEYFRTCPKCQLLISKAIRTKQDSLELDGVQPRAQPPCIYVMGGRNSTDSQLQSTERYDFLLDQWIHMVSLTQCLNFLFVKVFDSAIPEREMEKNGKGGKLSLDLNQCRVCIMCINSFTVKQISLLHAIIISKCVCVRCLRAPQNP